MPRRLPSYRLHRPSGQAVVTLDGRDHYLGRHGSPASRAAYEWIHTAVPDGGEIQANPKVQFQDTFGMYYGDRHNIAAAIDCLTMFGGDASQCPKAVGPLQRVYSAKDGLRAACDSIPADMLVAKDTDPLWADHASWVWTEKPAYANDYVRLFSCKALPLRAGQ